MARFKSLSSDYYAFFGLTQSVIVRYGTDYKLPKGQNTVAVVYSIMLLDIARHYNCLPDLRTLKMTEIRFFYDGIRSELKELSKNGK
jgi:hypothetical protein